MRIPKNVQIGLLVAVLCCIVAVSGCTSSNNNTSSNKSSLNTSNTSTSGSNDVMVVISYSGSWAADVSGQFGYRSLAGTGDQTTNLGSITGPLTVAARKTEGGSGVLTVSITKNGQTISSASTNSPYGGATAYVSI